MTPHIEAASGDFAKTVLMPGDPLRAEFIAKTYLDNVREVNRVRNMLAFTGTYGGKPVSVMGSGMGMPSMGIYSWELFTEFEVDRIIRIGSCGAYTHDLELYDVVLATRAYSETSFGHTQNGDASPYRAPAAPLNAALINSANALNAPLKTGTVHSSDVFYRQDMLGFHKIHAEFGAICVEMEAFALFHNAHVLKKEAACLLTVSDSLVTEQTTSADTRQHAFTRMMDIALGVI